MKKISLTKEKKGLESTKECALYILLYTLIVSFNGWQKPGGTEIGREGKLVFISRFKPISNKNFINKIRRSFAATRRELSK